jgi:uncharacterized protein (DUF2164 family)
MTDERLDEHAYYAYQGAKDAKKVMEEDIADFKQIKEELKRRRLLSSIWLQKGVEDYL